ncbi:MAG: 3-deoxy-7-phosphoheptulonate synthase [Candidatus Eremiobacteraeota bacterium]|nr:3-deoxy-7-phosphoheptulonate synthase [Candidatus Eremiobacteraeota bacterium]MBV9647607.1 3-deoxy-7-phosphoheptulonate synthase [Candidatus Eremiobacteraeota bacterium]
MIIVMRTDASDEEIAAVTEHLSARTLTAHVSRGSERTIVGVVGITQDKDTLAAQFSQLQGVESVIPISRSFKLVSREGRTQTTVRLAGGAIFGGNEIAICAGPCSVESRPQLMGAAEAVRKAGANVLRGGAFKPRTSPYAFQGLGEEGLKLLREAADRSGLSVVTEVLDVRDVEVVLRYADMLQIGARNMQNFGLLRAVGEARVPVLLKRGISATIEEWLMAAEYIFVAGNHDVVLCERGIRSFDSHTRNLLDISAVPLLHHLTHLPVVVDPSHGTGVRDFVGPMSLAAVAAGADGLLIEVHPNPAAALCDGPQSLNPAAFEELMRAVEGVATAVGRRMPYSRVAAAAG